jgi:hypothetical protein
MNLRGWAAEAAGLLLELQSAVRECENRGPRLRALLRAYYRSVPQPADQSAPVPSRGGLRLAVPEPPKRPAYPVAESADDIAAVREQGFAARMLR